MKLGVSLGYSGAKMELPVEHVMLAERLGYDSAWTAEAYGSDAVTPLAYLAAKTTHIRLGTGIMQLAGRTAAMCAMQAQTVDALAGGNRFIAGLGVSGPQIVEGWYGEPWGRPYYRLKDYIEIMQKIFERRGPVSHQGKEIVLPYPKDAKGSSGLGKPLMSILHPNPYLPIWLGAGNESTIRLTGHLCQGLLPLNFIPGSLPEIAPWLEEGFARAGGDKGWDGFEIQSGVSVTITEDLRTAWDARKPGIALYVGGMGAREKNFHNDQMIKAGYGEEAKKIQDLFLAGRKDEATAVVPDEYVDARMLVGPPDRIRERYQAWAQSGVTGLTVQTSQPEALELMADIASETPAIGPVKALAAAAAAA